MRATALRPAFKMMAEPVGGDSPSCSRLTVRRPDSIAAIATKQTNCQIHGRTPACGRTIQTSAVTTAPCGRACRAAKAVSSDGKRECYIIW